MSCIHRAIEEHRSCVVPATQPRLVHHRQINPQKALSEKESQRPRVVTYEFDGDLLVVQQIGSLKNNTKGTLADLLPHPVMDADDV